MDHNDFSISYWRGKHEIWSNDEYIFMCLWMNLCLLNCFSLLHYPQLLTTQGHCPSTAVTAVWLHLKTRPNWHTVFGATVYSPTSKEISDSCTCKKKLFFIKQKDSWNNTFQAKLHFKTFTLLLIFILYMLGEKICFM